MTHASLFEMLHGTTILENNLVDSWITKQATSIWLSSCISGHLSEKNENTFTQEPV